MHTAAFSSALATVCARGTFSQRCRVNVEPHLVVYPVEGL